MKFYKILIVINLQVYAAGTAIESSLKQLAERRTDIFGVGDEETGIGKKLGEEETRKDERVTWDGHTSSVEAATRAARANITLEDQIHQIHKVKGLLPDEEKEKIGPKPVGGAPSSKQVPVIMSQAQIVVPPKPPQMMQQQNAPLQQQSPQQQQMQHAPPVMMMQMRPPPMMRKYCTYKKFIFLKRPKINDFSTKFTAPPFPMGFMPGMPGQQPIAPAPPIMEQPIPIPEEEPPSKKTRTEDNLLPEAEFLAMHNGPVSLQVQVPANADKPEWRLNGQIMALNVQLSDTVSSLKSKLQEETGLPPAKQKLSYDGMFFKDNNTIAFYNLLSGTTVQLQIKERGGRKK